MSWSGACWCGIHQDLASGGCEISTPPSFHVWRTVYRRRHVDLVVQCVFERFVVYALFNLHFGCSQGVTCCSSTPLSPAQVSAASTPHPSTIKVAKVPDIVLFFTQKSGTFGVKEHAKQRCSAKVSSMAVRIAHLLLTPPSSNNTTPSSSRVVVPALRGTAKRQLADHTLARDSSGSKRRR